MSDFVIEKNVPLPTLNRRGAVGSRYPFDMMQVGDSFAIDASGPVVLSYRTKSLRSIISRYSKAHNKKFSVYKMSDTQIRIWRTA